MLENLLIGLQAIITPECILLLIAGTIFGIIVGAIPGLSATTAIALLIPITYVMDPMPAFAMIAGIFNGGMYGGSISAVLFNVPGTAANLVTCFDGYPLTQQGRAKRALQLCTLASLFGGTVSVFALLLLAPQLAKVALVFGAREYFWVGMMGVSVVLSLSQKDLRKGFMSVLLGMLCAMVGTDPAMGHLRYTMGNINLMSGFQTTSILLGMFTVPTAIALIQSSKGQELVEAVSKNEKVRLFSNFFRYVKNYIISAIIGIVVGIIPAAGANIAVFISYDVNKKLSKHPEEYGKGSFEGIIASESCNNGVTGGAFVPLLTLGIPGNATCAVIMSAFIIQGINLGPRLFDTNPDLVYGLMWALFFSNFAFAFLGFYCSSFFSKALKVSRNILAPLILCFTILGCYSLKSNLFDVGTVIAFGIISYLFQKFGFSQVAFVLGFILCPIIESNLLRIFQQYRGNLFEGFFGSGVTWVLIILTVLMAAFPYIMDFLTKGQIADDDGE